MGRAVLRSSVREFLAAYEPGDSGEIVTGAGHHSKGGESHAKIKPAVESILTKAAICKFELDHAGGAIKVDI